MLFHTIKCHFNEDRFFFKDYSQHCKSYCHPLTLEYVHYPAKEPQTHEYPHVIPNPHGLWQPPLCFWLLWTNSEHINKCSNSVCGRLSLDFSLGKMFSRLSLCYSVTHRALPVYELPPGRSREKRILTQIPQHGVWRGTAFGQQLVVIQPVVQPCLLSISGVVDWLNACVSS